MVRIWHAYDVGLWSASAWIDSRGTINIPVGREVAAMIGLVPTGGGAFKRRRCALANVPGPLRPHVTLAVQGWVTHPGDHPYLRVSLDRIGSRTVSADESAGHGA